MPLDSSAMPPPSGAAPSLLAAAHEQFVLSRTLRPCVRPVVASSWRRCALAGTSPDGHTPPRIRMGGDRLEEYRSHHPLAAVLPLLGDLLGEPAHDGEHIFAIADAAGTLLWVRGHTGVRRGAERIGFSEGAAWSEPQAGTNAPGTALALGHPVQIRAAEHYNTLVHPWSCSAAPIRDPDSGLVLGAVDLTGGEHIAGPHALALVRAAARAAEGELARLRHAPAGAPCQRAAAPGTVRMKALGRDGAVLSVDGRVLRLSPRHSEIIVVLTLMGDGGLPGGRLAVEVFEEETHPSTVRAEMTRLRAVLGSELLGSRPYTLCRPVVSDFVAVRDLLAEGRVREALAAYAGPLLPASRAPAITAYRRVLEQQLRGAVLSSGDPVLLRRWVNAEWGADDACAWWTLARQLPGGSSQRASAANRARALDEEQAPGPRSRPVAAAPAVPTVPARLSAHTSPAVPDVPAAETASAVSAATTAAELQRSPS